MENNTSKFDCNAIPEYSFQAFDGHIVQIKNNIEELKKNCQDKEKGQALDTYFKEHPVKFKPIDENKIQLKIKNNPGGRRG